VKREPTLADLALASRPPDGMLMPLVRIVNEDAVR
jgi:hypothetical protein